MTQRFERMGESEMTPASEVVVFGATGLLGATLCPTLEMFGYKVFRQGRGVAAELCCNPADVTDVAEILEAVKPTAIVNLVALSNVDHCEANVKDAYMANVRPVEALCSAIAGMKSKPHLIQVSTDHVYSGAGPHVEEAAVPINVYALTKFAGELVALRAGATVMRTNFFGKSQSPRRKSFTDWIYDSLISGGDFTVFDDVLFGGLHMPTLAAFVAKAVELKQPGLFNVGARHGVSKAKFAQLFAAHLGFDAKAMRVGSVRDLSLVAPRPTDMRMDVSAFERIFNAEMPDMEEQINAAADEYRRNS